VAASRHQQPPAHNPTAGPRVKTQAERRFRPILRMYQPQKAILDGTYVLPAVRKVD